MAAGSSAVMARQAASLSSRNTSVWSRCLSSAAPAAATSSLNHEDAARKGVATIAAIAAAAGLVMTSSVALAEAEASSIPKLASADISKVAQSSENPEAAEGSKESKAAETSQENADSSAKGDDSAQDSSKSETAAAGSGAEVKKVPKIPNPDSHTEGAEDSDAEDDEDAGIKFYIPPAEESKVQIFSGNGNWYLANEVSMHLGVQLGRATVKRFADGEVSVNILDNVRGKDVFVIQPLAPPVNENLMELLLMVTTLRRSSAGCITAVIPYYGYCRSTRKEKDVRSPIGAADVAKMLQVAGVDHVIAVDLHHSQIMGMFGPDTPVDNLDVSSLAIPYFETKYLHKPVVVSPDANGAARAKIFRDKLIKRKIDSSLAIIVDHESKKRGWESDEDDSEEATDSKKKKKGSIQDWTEEELEGMELVGDVQGRDCIIFDDMVDSAGRITRAAKKLKLAGARRVFAFTTHGLFLGNAYERIEKSELIEVVCVNTVPLATSTVRGVNSWVYSNKVHQLSVAALLAEAIRRITEKKSVTKL